MNTIHPVTASDIRRDLGKNFRYCPDQTWHDEDSQKHVTCSSSQQCQPAANIGLTGFNIISHSQANWARRIIWLVLLIAFTATTVYHSVDFFQKFIANKIETSFSQLIVKEIPVPAITICHQNKFKKSVIEEMIIANKTYEDWLRSPEFSLLDWERHTLEDLVSYASYSLEEMLYECEIHGYPCEYYGYFGAANYSQRMGLCYTFHTEEQIYESLISGQISITFRDQEQLSLHEHQGWVVVIHANDMPFTDLTMTAGVALPVLILANDSMEVRATKKQLSFLKTLDDEGNVSCEDYTPDDVMDCMNKCLRHPVTDCYLPWTVRMPGQNSCSSFDDYLQAIERFQQNSNSHDLLAATDSCNCPLPCEYSLYSLSVPYVRSMSHLRRQGILNELANGTFGHMSIWLKNIVEVVVETRPYQWPQFSSDLGGMLGLMLGASLLTVAEVIDYLICLFLSFLSRKK